MKNKIKIFIYRLGFIDREDINASIEEIIIKNTELENKIIELENRLSDFPNMMVKIFEANKKIELLEKYLKIKYVVDFKKVEEYQKQ